MEKCDFASVMQIIRSDLIEGSFSNQIELIEQLFKEYIEEGADDVFFDASQVNKWFHGLLKPSPAMCYFYASDEVNRDALADRFVEVIIPCLSDPSMVSEKIYELLVQDSSISETKKQELIQLREDAFSYFLADVLIFGMSRPFTARDIRKPPKYENSAKSPSVQDYIFDADAPKPCRTFCGRDAELAALHDALMENDKVFLQGIPGIGKSEIAKAYAKAHKKYYTNILYFIYGGDLKRDIADLQFADDQESDDEGKRFQRHNCFLRTLKEDTLLIIDNFNTTAGQEELLPVVMKYKCRILFTTKTVFEDQACVTVEEIEDRAVLYDLFSQLFREADDHRTTVEAIMETIHYHTLSIELAARLAQSGMLTLEQILSKLREEKQSFSSADEIRISKDGQKTKATYYQHITTLFALFRLDQRQQYAMQCMSMMPLSGIEARLFAKWIGFTELNTIRDLEELGFIREEENRDLSLHPMMQDVTIADLKPGVKSCQTMLVNIGNFCHQYGRDVPHGRLIKQIVESTIRAMEKDDPDFYIRFLQQAYCSLNDPSCHKDFLPFIDEIERLLKDEKVGTPEDRAHLLEYQADMESTAEKMIPKLEQAIAIYPEPNAANVVDLYTLHAKTADLCRRRKKYERAFSHLKTAIDLSNRFPGHENENRRLVIGYASLLNDTGQPEAALKEMIPLEEKLRRVMPNTYEHATVLRKLAGMTANCGDIDKGLALLDEAWQIYEFICAGNEGRLHHYGALVNEVRQGILIMRKHPGRKLAGF